MGSGDTLMPLVALSYPSNILAPSTTKLRTATLGLCCALGAVPVQEGEHQACSGGKWYHTDAKGKLKPTRAP